MKTILFVYIVLFTFFSIFTYAFVDPNFPPFQFLYKGVWPDFRILLTVVYIFILLLLFLVYAFILKSVLKSLTFPKFFQYLLVSTFVLLLAYPSALSYDIFNYMATARVTFLYQENPYIVMPIEMTGDSMLGFTRAANKIALYGPSWILLTIVPFTLGFGDLLLTTILFKIFVGIFYFGIVCLLYKFTRNIFATALFALNPLVLLETFVSGHNDVVMMFFGLLAFYFILRKKRLFSGVALAVSILVKFSTLFLIPVWIFCIWKLARREKIDWEKVWLWSFILMLVVFILSPLREEMYPWYAIWFLTFIPFIRSKGIQYGSIALSLGLMLRYIPYMLLGTYAYPTPILRTVFTLIPLLLFVPFYLLYVRKHD